MKPTADLELWVDESRVSAYEFPGSSRIVVRAVSIKQAFWLAGQRRSFDGKVGVLPPGSKGERLPDRCPEPQPGLSTYENRQREEKRAQYDVWRTAADRPVEQQKADERLVLSALIECLDGAESKPISYRELGERTGLDPTVAQLAVKRLVAMKIIESFRGKSSRNYYRLAPAFQEYAALVVARARQQTGGEYAA